MRKKFDQTRLSLACDSNKSGKKFGSIAFKTGVTIEQARSAVNHKEDNENSVIRNCAGILRRAISSSEKTPLKTDTAENVISGEVAVPKQVNYFFKKLYSRNKHNSKKKKRLVESSAADAVYCASGSRLLPGKHVGLGLALKSLTGSRRAINLLNRNGHCASNETLRRIDMDMEESSSVKCSGIVPDGISKQRGKSTGTAWDNLDINMETINGLGTIHHTYGIIYQNISVEPSIAEDLATHVDLSHSTSVELNIAEDHVTNIEDSSQSTSVEPSIEEDHISNVNYSNQDSLVESSIAEDHGASVNSFNSDVGLAESGQMDPKSSGKKRKFKKVTPTEINTEYQYSHITRSPK